MAATLCNVCHRRNLSLYDSSAGLRTYKCQNPDCGEIIQFLNNGGDWQLVSIVFGGLAAASGFSGLKDLLEFFGVDSVSDLVDLLG